MILSGDFFSIKRYCVKSEPQFLDRKPVTFEISDNGGLEIPDVICQEGIWFVSDKMKDILDNRGADHIFYKKAEIVSKKFGIFENFWIMVVPRIDCLDIDESVLDNNWDFSDGIIPNMNFEKICISPKLIGRYEIFKIIGINDFNIYVTQEMRDVLLNQDLTGFTAFKI